jgi:hypothetical protein
VSPINPAAAEKYFSEARDRWETRDPSAYNWQHSFSLAPGATPDRVRLSGTVAKASLPEHADWQQKNPALTSMYRYRGPGSFGTGNYEVGENLRGLLASNNMWQRAARSGMVPAALKGGLAGVAGGSILGLILGMIRGDAWGGMRTGALAGGALGAGLGGYAGHNFSKQASADSLRLKALLSADSTVGFTEKARLQKALDSLSDVDIRAILQLVSGLGGAGVGALIAKFLLGSGKGGMLMGAAVGGFLGAGRLSGKQTNAFGQRVSPGTNVFGQKL